MNNMAVSPEGEALRYDALDLSVKLHSMANHSPNSVPAGTQTVLNTAKAFEDYLVGKGHDINR